MSAEVKILLEGYTNAGEVAETGEERKRPTITLVRDGDLIMVVDPGILVDRQILIEALALENIAVEDVNVVCITHSRLAHYKNAGMFPNAKVLEYFGLWDKDRVDDWSEHFSPNIMCLRTPGHDASGITLMVNTEDGKVAICGDIFWRENFPADIHDDRYATDPKKLAESRKMVLAMADWVIPGHGPMYPTHKEEIKEEKASIGFKKKVADGSLLCKKCGKQITREKEKCLCRPWLCYRCCECGFDCNVCNCSHKVLRMRMI